MKHNFKGSLVQLFKNVPEYCMQGLGPWQSNSDSYHRNPHIVSSKSNQYSTICYKVEYWFDFELLMSGCYIIRHVMPEVVIFSWPHNWKLIIKTNCFIFSYQNLLIWAQKYIIYLFKSYLIGLVVWATIYYIFVFNFPARIWGDFFFFFEEKDMGEIDKNVKDNNILVICVKAKDAQFCVKLIYTWS